MCYSYPIIKNWARVETKIQCESINFKWWPRDSKLNFDANGRRVLFFKLAPVWISRTPSRVPGVCDTTRLWYLAQCHYLLTVFYTLAWEVRARFSSAGKFVTTKRLCVCVHGARTRSRCRRRHCRQSILMLSCSHYTEAADQQQIVVVVVVVLSSPPLQQQSHSLRRLVFECFRVKRVCMTFLTSSPPIICTAFGVWRQYSNNKRQSTIETLSSMHTHSFFEANHSLLRIICVAACLLIGGCASLKIFWMMPLMPLLRYQVLVTSGS